MLTDYSLVFFCFLFLFLFDLFLLVFPFRRNELARKVVKDFLLDLQSGTLDL